MQIIIPTLMLFFSGSFGLYSMHKNDSIVTNKFLFLHGWFFFAGVSICFIYYIMQLLSFTALINHSGIYLYVDQLFSPLMTVVFCVGFILFGLYLYSLKRPCMMPQYLPRTFKIFVRKKIRKFLSRLGVKYRTPKPL